MIRRIVKLSFRTDKADDFLTIYHNAKDKISSFPGCHGVELLRDIHKPNVFFTYSLWESEEDLNNYRNSELFGVIWKATKALFNSHPEAWSAEAN